MQQQNTDVLKILERTCQLLTAHASRINYEGDECILCDAGSVNDGQHAVLRTNINPSTDKCTILCDNGKLEQTFGIHLSETYRSTNLLKKNQRIQVNEPDAQDDGRYGFVSEDAQKGKQVKVILDETYQKGKKVDTFWSKCLKAS